MRSLPKRVCAPRSRFRSRWGRRWSGPLNSTASVRSTWTTACAKWWQRWVSRSVNSSNVGAWKSSYARVGPGSMQHSTPPAQAPSPGTFAPAISTGTATSTGFLACRQVIPCARLAISSSGSTRTIARASPPRSRRPPPRAPSSTSTSAWCGRMAASAGCPTRAACSAMRMGAR